MLARLRTPLWSIDTDPVAAEPTDHIEEEDDDDDGIEDEEMEEEVDDEGVEDGEKGENGKQMERKVKGEKKNLKEKGSREADVTEGKTLFVRNVLFETTAESLQERFSQFGELVYCLLVQDPITKRPRGTAFVKYVNRESADEVFNFLRDTNEKGEKNEIVVDGRPLLVTSAIDKVQATALKEPEKHRDKRNLYLLNEGYIAPDSPAAAHLSKIELAIRERSRADNKKKLQNPNFSLSRTRLCVRNLPLFVDDKELKRVFLDAARQRESELPTANPPKVKQVKVLKEKSATGLPGKSKGIAFIEFEEHHHALKALRYLNNNPHISYSQDLRATVNEEDEKDGDPDGDVDAATILKGRKAKERQQKIDKQISRSRQKVRGRLIVEFAIENALALRKLRDHQKRGLMTNKKDQQDEAAAQKKKIKNEKNNLRKKKNKESKAENALHSNSNQEHTDAEHNTNTQTQQNNRKNLKSKRQKGGETPQEGRGKEMANKPVPSQVGKRIEAKGWGEGQRKGSSRDGDMVSVTQKKKRSHSTDSHDSQGGKKKRRQQREDKDEERFQALVTDYKKRIYDE